MADDDHEHELIAVKAEFLGLVLVCRCGWWDATVDPAVARELWLEHVPS